MPRGYLALVLHAHLPFVRHPEHPHFLEEGWLYEAITETYLPLVDRLWRLHDEGVPFRLALGVTPTLLSMLADPLLQERYSQRLAALQELADREEHRTRSQPEALHRLACMYQSRLARARQLWEGYGHNLIRALRDLQDSGHVEILASAATHGYLPLLALQPEAVRAQIAVGVQAYRHDLGRNPCGFWLPECGYSPGLDRFLASQGIRYFLTDAHGLLFARPRPRYANYAPVFTPAGVAAFGRDLESAKQVWSATEGYPGDYWYRDFYRDIGFDLDEEYLRPYLPPGPRGPVRSMLGIKYHRITGPTPYKEWYDPERARERYQVHAGNFLFNRERQVEWLADHMDRPPVVVCPYDAELFGHWWYEGPDWLEQVFRNLAARRNEILEPITPGDYLERHPRCQVAEPAQSSWGYQGYSEVWLNGSNDWIYPHLHLAAQRMVELVRRYPRAEGWRRRALNQAARELLLAQSSDWAFIMKAGTMVEYAVGRTRQHLHHFHRLFVALTGQWPAPAWRDPVAGTAGGQQTAMPQAGQPEAPGGLDPWLSALEERDNLFPFLDYRVYWPLAAAASGA